MFQYAFKMHFDENEEIYFDKNYFAVKNSYYIQRVFNLRLPAPKKEEYSKKDSLGVLILSKKNFFAKAFFKLCSTFLKLIGAHDHFIKNYTSVFTEESPERKISSVFRYHSKESLARYTTFMGCFQNPKYFDHKRKKVLSAFSFPEIKDKKNLKISRKIKNCNSVSIHVRLDDYTDSVNAPKFFNLSESDYYDKAAAWIKEKVKNPVFFVFSDDAEKAGKLFRKLGDCYFINWNKGDRDFRDMQLMSLCRHNIIANSSFSFWGAYLNKNPDKIVVAPGRYFKKEDEICEYDKKWKVIMPKTKKF